MLQDLSSRASRPSAQTVVRSRSRWRNTRSMRSSKAGGVKDGMPCGQSRMIVLALSTRPRAQIPVSAVTATSSCRPSWASGSRDNKPCVLPSFVSSLLSATQLQSLRPLHVASSFKALHAGGFLAGAFLSWADVPQIDETSLPDPFILGLRQHRARHWKPQRGSRLDHRS